MLESYVMGELSDAERAEVERLAVLHPAVREELRRIEEIQEHVLMNAGLSPPADVKAKILEQIVDRKSEPGIIPMNRASAVALWRFAAAASVSIAIVASILAYTYWSRWRKVDAQLITMMEASRTLASNYNQVNRRLDKLESDLIIIENPEFDKVVLKGTANAPDALASLYWNPSTREVYLRIQNLKQLSSDNQYQLWAIIDGKPVDAGVFDTDIAGLIRMKDIGKGATTFAVTIEPRGGKASPTLETMQVAGNISKV